MKFLVVLMLIAFTAVANEQEFDLESIYLTKETSTGHVLPEYAQTETCSIYFNGIVKRTSFHYTGIVKKVVADYGIKKESRINSIIEATFDGDLVKEAYPADANSVKYVAGFKKGTEERLMLLSESNGGTGVKTVNNSIQAKRLVVLIDELCK